MTRPVRRHTQSSQPSSLPNVARALDALGWTRSGLAERAGIAKSYVYDLVDGRRTAPSSQKEEAIARAFGLPRHVLINEELTDLELRSALSHAALQHVANRLRSSPGRLLRLLNSSVAPLTAERWLEFDQQLQATLDEAETPPAPPLGAEQPELWRNRPR